MKLLQQREETTKDKKFIKSQVEKRRRERMNSSLEHLRTMLVQGPQNLDGTRSRVEKAEILEHTVLFLQKTAKEEQRSAEGGGGGGARGRQKHSFQEGVSTCLQRAAQFLGPEGKGLWLGTSLDSSFAARFSHLDSGSTAGLLKKPEADSSSSSLSHTKSILRMLRQKSKHRLQTGAKSFSHQYRLQGQQEFPTVPQQAQTQNESRVESQGGKQSPSLICPVIQTIWRPWP